MSRIFLSHSCHNNAQACALRDWLAEHGWDDVFLDLDPRRGLIAGQRWQEALKKAADRCEAVVFLLSPAWAASKWCLAEFLLAKSLGKHVFGVVVEEVDLAELPSEMTGEFQLARLVGSGATETFATQVPGSESSVEVRFTKEGLERLRRGLEQAGLDARSFKLDLTRPRYVGLRPLDTRDAAIFFGRDADIVRGMDLIRRMRGAGQRILVVLGASGSGKSSFVRAGLWPRLDRADREFFALPMVRPENAALEGQYGLVSCLAAAGSGLHRNRAHWREALAQPEGLTAALRELLAPREAGDAPRPLPVLVVDQAEELFHADAGAEAASFLDRLAVALRGNAVLAIFSIRSDAYERLQSAPQLDGIEQKLYSLPPLAAGAVKDVIEGPARREREERGAEALQIDPELTERLMRDWSGSDALPLLAFTLERLVHDYGGDGRITLVEYEASGGLGGAIEAAVAKALRAAVAAREVGSDPSEQQSLLRAAFVPWLVRVDAETRIGHRRLARFDELPAAASPLVARLIDAGLLTSDLRRDSGVDAKVVEVAHEALLSRWPLLHRLVEEQRDELAALEQVKRDAGAWAAAGRTDDALLHRGGRLSHAEASLARDEMQAALGTDGRDYLRACRQRESEAADRVRDQQERERRQLARTRKAQRWATALLAVVALVVAAAGFGLARIGRTAAQSRSNVLAGLAGNAYDLGQYDRALRFALSGMAGRHSRLMGFDASAAELQLARASYRTALRLRLVGHEGRVRAAAFSPDGTRVVTASEDTTARLWDAVTGRECAKLLGHEKVVLSVAFSPDGSQVVTASGDQTARLWDAATGREFAKLGGHEEVVSSAAFSPDGTRVVTASFDRTARLWDVLTGRELIRLEGHKQAVLMAAFSPNGTEVVTASGDGTARIWDALTGRELTQLRGHEAVLMAAFSSDGTRVLTGSVDGTARVWLAATGSELARLDGHEKAVLSAAFSPDGTRVVTASGDGTALLWDVATGRELSQLDAHDVDVLSAAFSPDGTLVVTASADGIARLWVVATGRRLTQLDGHENAVLSAAFSPDGTRVVTASVDGTARVWVALNELELAKLGGHKDEVWSAAFNHDGTRVVTASFDGTGRLWDSQTGREIAKLGGHDGAVLNAAFNHDGTRVVTASFDGTGRLWDGQTGREIAKLEGHDGAVVSAAFSRDGARVVTASSDGTGRLWDGQTGREIAKLEGHEDVVQSAAFSRDGTRVITASLDGTGRIWDGQTGRELVELEAGERGLVSAAFSPDGTMVVTISAGGSALLWNGLTGRKLAKLEDRAIAAAFSPDGSRVVTATGVGTGRSWDPLTGHELAKLEGHRGGILSIAFSPDRSRVVTASGDRTARVWDSLTGLELATLEGHLDTVRSAVFSPDGNRIVTASEDGTARIWETRFVAVLRAQDLIDASCREVLSVDVNAEPFAGELSRFSHEELQLAPVLDPAIDGDACRPATSWQRLKGMLGWR